MTLMIVVSTTINGEQHGVAAQVPDGWIEDPTKAEMLMFGAMQMFVTHCRKEKINLMIGQDVVVHFEEI